MRADLESLVSAVGCRWCPPSGEESPCGLGVLGASRYRYAIIAVRGAMR